MKNRLPLTDKEGEVRELTTDDFARFKPATEVLPDSLLKKLGVSKRGPQKSPVKERITIRLSPDVLMQFRATGDGWQTRMDGALRDWLKDHALTH
ncbi:BrnA antitoxin family protein [Glaciimonas immobilis]|uniref:Uncharacterized protein (DUF4415 family) n=1 Tax=Glaciimonas immobilis TaxID=728004 RepID=A0A840RNI5_9BURK|nr:BrnA antitoxin family protein [Glaciimonas immobilis]KAF3999204.1 BrnA antitoxin family protein [Glaciimonas immobilis]MBB5198662.1 uncharacterized protein (DUF4415 family) [Glaciimonas immobilis]